MLKALLLFSLLCSTAFAATMPPKLGPEGGRFNRLHVYKIEKMLANKLAEKSVSASDAEEVKKVQMILANGKKASQWITLVNTARPADHQLDLSANKKSGGIPITAPQLSNTDIMMKRYEDYMAKNPAVITDVVSGKSEMTTTPPLSDEEFVTSLRTLDRIYQSTIRWASSMNWLEYMEKISVNDMRGFIFLRDTPNLNETLKSYPAMNDVDQTKYRNWMLELCRNGEFEMDKCTTDLRPYIESNNLIGYYNLYNQYGQKVHDNFFTIQKTRPEIYWNPEKTVLTTPFQTPERSDVQAWMKDNVQDEWKGPRFNLVFEFKTTTEDIPRIEFKEGTTAHVNDIAGNVITMEAEYPINTIDMKWTIRHEYGHVLGFQDCYLEFYDSLAKTIVYYEIDVDNLMCSRNGHLKASHIEQLQSAY
ncbi:MAG: hypothetical protein H7336_08625 [Bacteriovorax sp.]|nr:hypothetical protein [Bacteriovorax sp.]